jgi:ArsR family transcriptional regulator, arsenate/arsenite/antimonite-responsive transcriptional repressor
MIMRTEARLFKSLADETRLEILWLLMEEKELCVCDIMHVLGITQSKASRHLRYLFNLGLVSDRREGAWMNYRLAAAPDGFREKQLKLLREMLLANPRAQVLQEKLRQRLQAKSQLATKEACECA